MHFQAFHRSSLIALTASIGLAFGAVAQTSGSGTSASPSTTMSGSSAKAGSVSSADRQFIQKAAMGGMAEVELGKLAQEKASSDEVKKFGEHMVEDHGKANEELKSIASTEGVQVSTELDKKHKATMQKLEKLSGAEFDREYMKQMVTDHKKTVADFKKQADSGKDAELKAFAAKTLPTLQEHLKMAQSLSDSTKSAKRGADKKS